MKLRGIVCTHVDKSEAFSLSVKHEPRASHATSLNFTKFRHSTSTRTRARVEMGRNGKKIRLIIPGSITDLMIPTARPQGDDHVVKRKSRELE